MIKRCVNCGKARRIHARGLCLACYQHPATRAPITHYPKAGPSGPPPQPGSIRRIAIELGIARQTVRLALAQGRLIQTDAGWIYYDGRKRRD